MSQRQPVVWFADDPKPSTFFFRPLFRSGRFLFGLASTFTICILYGIEVWRNWAYVSEHPGLLVIPIPLLVYPSAWAIKLHGQIREICEAGGITEQPVDSPIGRFLRVTDEFMTAWLVNSFLIGMLLVMLVLPSLRQAR